MLQRPQSGLALWASALLLVFEKFTRAYLFQIALEIMRLPILMSLHFALILSTIIFCSITDTERPKVDHI